MKVIILLLTIGAFIYQSDSKGLYDIILNNVVYKFDPEIANFTLSILNKKILTIEGEFFREIPTMTFFFEISTIDNQGGYKPLISNNIDFCDFKKQFWRFPMAKAVFEPMLAKSSWDFSCPFPKGPFYTRDFQVVSDGFPIGMPNTDFRLFLDFKESDNIPLWNVSYFGSIKYNN